MSANNRFTLLAFAIALTLTGCGGSSSGSGSSSTAPSLSGTAATGAAINNGTVTAVCANGLGFQNPVTTDAQGKWTGTLTDASALPCALQVTFTRAPDPERTLHSFASSVGTINITPLTDLTLALALGSDPAAWFTSLNATSAVTAAELDTAANDFLAALVTKGYSKPSTGNPFTTVFNADGSGWDGLLDDLKEAIPDYDAFLQGIATSGIVLANIPEAPAGPGNSETLGNNSGVTALFNGERKTSFRFKDSYRGTPVGAGVGYASFGDDQYTFDVRINGISSFVNGGVNCNANGIPSVSVAIDGVFYRGTDCVVTTTAVTDTVTQVGFSGTLARDGQHATAPATLEITDGEFQYVAKPFATSNGVPQVFASFEGITPSANGNSASNVAVSAGDTGWAYDWKQIIAVDVSSTPLSVTPANGEALSGGNTAVTLLSNTNILSGEFDNDAYVSLLLRVKQPEQGSGLLADQKIYIGNAGIYIGLGGTSFVASIGDNQNEKASFGNFDHSTTYHLVARLYKSQGADHFDRLEYWLDPARNASAVPAGTVSRTTSNSGNMKLINYLGSYSSATNVTIDRIVASTTWDGLFTADD